MELKEFIENQIPKLLNMTTVNGIDRIFDMPTMLLASVSFYPVEMNNDGIALIVTGVKEKPAGLSVTESNYVLFYNREIEKTKYILVEDLKSLIKERWSELEKKIDGSYENLGVLINVYDL